MVEIAQGELTSLAELVRECRSCGSTALFPFLSLGMTPIANSLANPSRLTTLEPMYPLAVAKCADCHLAQLSCVVPQEAIFNADYPYYSSFIETVTSHGRRHACELVETHGLTGEHLVVEIGSNDGYLLEAFREQGVRVLGIDPSPGPAAAAETRGIPTLVEFFSADVARRLVAQGKRADVIVANNVMAHVPNLNDLVDGFATLIAEDGVITIENPYLLDLIEHGEFDTIYHEHFCYFSCLAVDRLMRRHGLFLNSISYFPELHGGTLRWTVGRRDAPDASVRQYLARERAMGVDTPAFYRDFGMKVIGIQKALLDLLYELRQSGARIAAYGAAAKGATLLNTLRMPRGLIRYVVDRNVHKQGLLMPGVRLEIKDPAVLLQDRPDYLLLLAWNHAPEIVCQLEDYRRLGGKFIIPIPEARVVAGNGSEPLVRAAHN